MSVWITKPDVYDVLANLAPMRRYARALIRDESAAEDLVHDALVRAYEKRSTFRLGGNLRSWLLSILHNTFIDGQRRQKAEERRVSETAESADSWLPAGQENAIRLQQIKQAFLGLPPEQRSVLHLVAIEGMKYQVDFPVEFGSERRACSGGNGAGKVSLFAAKSMATPGPVPLSTIRRPNSTTVYWEQGGLAFALTGSAAETALERAASQLGGISK